MEKQFQTKPLEHKVQSRIDVDLLLFFNSPSNLSQRILIRMWIKASEVYAIVMQRRNFSFSFSLFAEPRRKSQEPSEIFSREAKEYT